MAEFGSAFPERGRLKKEIWASEEGLLPDYVRALVWSLVVDHDEQKFLMLFCVSKSSEGQMKRAHAPSLYV
jgi:hypothetical protein